MNKLLLSAALFLLLGTVTAQAEYENPAVVGQVPDRIVIILQADVFPTVTKSAGEVQVDLPALDTLAKRFEIKDMSRLYDFAGPPRKAGAPDLRRVWAVDFSADKYDLASVLAAYAALPEVAEARAVDICKMYDVPNDVDANQWYLRNLSLGGKDIRAVGGWAEARGDSNIIVAIVDSGVDWMHPDLGGPGPDHVNGAIWTNWVEYYGTPGVDDDTNGKIDDIRGWDFVALSSQDQGYEDEDVLVADNDPMDYEGHGTNCSGCAAAITDNGIGIAGTSWGCKIMPVRAGWLPNGSEQGVVRMDFCSAGMIYAALNGAHIINCSWGSTSFLSMAVSTCVSEGCIIVTSAGNDNDENPSYLNSHPDVISAAATTPDDVKAEFSSYGTWVEVCAPGVNIYTTSWSQSTMSHTYASVAGTSFSSPITCGAAALIWSAHPGWSRNLVVSALINSCDNIDELNPGLEGKLGAGRINLLKALGDSFQEVPVEFPTLLDAMNEAAEGDTVAVQGSHILSGTKTIAAKELYIFGGYDATYSSRDPIANPTSIIASANKPALQFQAGTGSTTEVDGFLCTGGDGSFLASPIPGRYGGGILVILASPTLRNIQVTGNAVGTAIEFGGGGGIALINSSASLTNISVNGNTAIHGAGVFIDGGAPSFLDCQIYDNTSYAGNLTYTPHGGGFYVSATNLTLNNCQIYGHNYVDAGGGIYATNGGGTTTLFLTENEIHDNFVNSVGGGIYMDGDEITLLASGIYDNGYTDVATFSNGGGFYIFGGTAILDGVTCTGNSSHAGGGGFILSSTSPQVSNTLFAENQASFYGGGLIYQNNTGGSLSNNTFAINNGQISGAGGLYITNSSPALENNLIAFNTGATTFANGVHVGGGTPTFSCNDTYGNDGSQYGGVADPTGSNGNISEDPIFCDVATGNYHLNNNSPCAPENSGGCGLIGALGTGCVSDPVPDSGDVVPLAFKVDQNYPNPFNPATKIRFALPQRAFTTVRIFDLAGRLVRTLVAEELAAQVHEVTWNGRDGAEREVAAGVYFYQVLSDEHAFTGRMALVK